MPTYDYKCETCGYFELRQNMDRHATGQCPTCEEFCKQVLTRPPMVDVEGLADAGCPGALETSGNRMEKRHKEAGQDHHYWRDDVSTKEATEHYYKSIGTSAYDD